MARFSSRARQLRDKTLAPPDEQPFTAQLTLEAVVRN